MSSVDEHAAEQFILREARLLDRHRFAFRFRAGDPAPVVAALLVYRNADGGFGHALEPDLRAAASQPVPLEHALHILDEVASFDPELVTSACDWLESVTTAEGGVPFVLPTVAEGPHAPWWKATGEAHINPTAGIVGLLHKHGIVHPWLERATAFCWRSLGERIGAVAGDDALSALVFLEHVPERERAEQMFGRLGDHIRRELVALDPETPGYVKMPLEFAPRPTALARRLFDDETIAAHLDALAAKQQNDGGWPITWEPPSTAAVSEWRGFMTIKWLDVLDAYGRLRANDAAGR